MTPFVSSVAPHASSRPTETPWRVVVESLPNGGDCGDLAVAHVFDDYAAAWQCADAANSAHCLVLLVDPAGPMLIDSQKSSLAD